jgi:hypothetical protein
MLISAETADLSKIMIEIKQKYNNSLGHLLDWFSYRTGP